MLKYWPFEGGKSARGDAYLGGLQAMMSTFDNEVLWGGGFGSTYSAGTDARDYGREYPILRTASGIHNLQLAQMIIGGLDIECFCDAKLPDGTRHKIPENLPRILKNPVPWDESRSFNVLSAGAVAADTLCGEIFIYKHPTKKGLVEGIEVIPNHEIRRLENYGQKQAVYEVTVSNTASIIKPGYYTTKNICHIITRPVLGYARGIGASQMATPAVINALMVDVFSAEYYQNALSIGGFIFTKGKTQDEIDEMEEKIANNFKGVNNSHRWMMMNAEEMDVKPMTPTPSNTHLIRASERSAIELGKLTGMSPTMANESITGALSYAIAGAHEIQYGKNRAQPFCKSFAGGINRDSPTRIMPYGKQMGFCLEDLLRGDERSRNAMIGKMVKDSLISVNKANQMMGFEGYDGENFDEPLAPGAWKPVSALGQEPEVEPEDDENNPMSEEELEAKLNDIVSELVDVAVREAAEAATRNGYYEFADYNMEA